MSTEEFPLLHLLEPGEVIESQAQADGFFIAVTGQRIVATDGSRTVLNIPFSELRRIQFDIERDRDATLVVVPEHIKNEPRVFSIPLENIMETAQALGVIGRRVLGQRARLIEQNPGDERSGRSRGPAEA